MHRPTARIALAAAVALAFAACGSKEDHDTGPVKTGAIRSTASALAKQLSGLPTGHLLYRRYLTDDQSQAAIYAVGPGETNGHAITHPPDGAADDLAVESPDGLRITFMRCTDQCHLYTAAIDGSGVKRLSPKSVPGETDDENNPGYSPDGRWLVYGRGWGEIKTYPALGTDQIQYSEIYRMTADGHRRERLTHRSGKGYLGDTGHPSFSPDGKQIVFAVLNSPDAPRPHAQAVFIMDADGSHQRRLTPWKLAAGGNGDYPRFSPDGSRILFRSHAVEGPGGDLYTVRPDGSDLRKLTHGIPGMLSAAYSPDGRYIAYARQGDDGEQPDIWVMNADGTDPEQLTDAPEWDSLPTWGV